MATCHCHGKPLLSWHHISHLDMRHTWRLTWMNGQQVWWAASNNYNVVGPNWIYVIINVLTITVEGKHIRISHVSCCILSQNYQNCRLKFKMGIPVPLRWFFLVCRGRGCWKKTHLAYQSEDIRKHVDAFAIHQARKLSFNCWTRINIVWFYSISTVRHPNALLWRNSVRHYYDAENG